MFRHSHNWKFFQQKGVITSSPGYPETYAGI